MARQTDVTLAAVAITGTVKVAIIVAAIWSAVERERRNVLFMVLILDLAYSCLTGLGRFSTGLDATVSSRYQYSELFCWLPFVASLLDVYIRSLAVRVVVTCVSTAFVAWPWPSAMRSWAEWRGMDTRHVLESPDAPEEGAIPGIPSMRTSTAKKLVAAYGLH